MISWPIFPYIFDRNYRCFLMMRLFGLVTLTLPFPRFEPWSRNVFVSTVHNGWWKKCFTQNVAWSYLIFEISIDDQYLILIWFVVDFWVFCPRYLWPLFSFCFKHSSGFEQWVSGREKRRQPWIRVLTFQIHRNDESCWRTLSSTVWEISEEEMQV